MHRDEQKCKQNADAYDRYFNNLIDTGLCPCISIVCAKGGDIHYRFLGGTDLPARKGRQVQEDIRFNVASVTKTLTAGMILKLAELGELSLTDPVVKLIPEYPFNDVTVQNLMTHTAGYDETRILSWPAKAEDLDAFYASIYAVTERKYQVNEASAYWTFCYAILADILKRITNRSVQSFAKEYLFDPLHMSHSTFDFPSLASEQVFVPWYEKEQRFFPETFVPVATGDNGLCSTAEDLLHYAQMILDGGVYEGRRVFSEATAALMRRDVTNGKFMKSPALWIKGNQDLYGCFGDLCSPQAAGHTGMTGCMLWVDPAYDIAAAVVTNSVHLHDDWNNYKRISNVLTAMLTKPIA